MRQGLRTYRALRSHGSLGKPKAAKPLAWGKVETRSAIDKGPWRSDAHIKWVKSHRCLKCWGHDVDPHHCRKLLERGNVLPRDDRYAVPLCRKCHDEGHLGDGGEREFWKKIGNPHLAFIATSEPGREGLAAIGLMADRSASTKSKRDHIARTQS